MIGIVGLGAMGAEMATRLATGAEPVFVYDLNPDAVRRMVDRGGVAGSSPKDVADHADTVLLSLPDARIVLDVAGGDDGVLAGSRVRTIVDLSTTGPAGAAQLRALTSKAGVDYLDAPVSGGPGGARAGTLTVMAAGLPETFARIEPVLRRLGKTILHVGDEPGQGQLVKVLNNLMSASAIAITAEALALATSRGLDPTRFLDAVNASSGRNTASADKFPRCVVPRTFDFGFRMALMTKDVSLALSEASDSHVPMVLGSAVGQLWQLADNTLGAGADCTELTRIVEAWAGVTIGGTP
jgi:3-hydroxyisobutyrate dehydrogenase-like beta-hydroxyacid dehydrogenase